MLGRLHERRDILGLSCPHCSSRAVTMQYSRADMRAYRCNRCRRFFVERQPDAPGIANGFPWLDHRTLAEVVRDMRRGVA